MPKAQVFRAFCHIVLHAVYRCFTVLEQKTSCAKRPFQAQTKLAASESENCIVLNEVLAKVSKPGTGPGDLWSCDLVKSRHAWLRKPSKLCLRLAIDLLDAAWIFGAVKPRGHMAHAT